jgi:RNA polymerase sigma-70 factor (ECF subfamily)
VGLQVENADKAEEDQRDVALVLSGNLDAFSGIVRRWQSPLINLAWRYFRDRGRAEDMAQEAFLRAFKSLATWRGDAAFSTWLFALATNLYRTELRRIPVYQLPLDDVTEPRDPHDLAAAFATRSRDEYIHRSVHTLPARYRDVLLLFYFHEMDLSLTASTLGLPEGTAKARLSRGRAILAKKLRPLLQSAHTKEAL